MGQENFAPLGHGISLTSHYVALLTVEAHEVIDAALIFFGPIVTYSGHALAVGPLLHGRAMILKVHQGHPEATRVRDPLNLNKNDRANSHTRRSRKQFRESVELRSIPHHAPAYSVESDNPWRSAEGAEHDHDASVFAKMGNRLNSAPRLIEIRDALRSAYRELLSIALRRTVE